MRIVSLVPSLTELIIDLGLEEALVGRTKFCIHPGNILSNIPKIGGTKNVRIDDVRKLRPDLIIANKEENTKADIEALRDIAEVYVSSISNYEDALSAIHHIGRITMTIQNATNIVNQIEAKFLTLQSLKKKNSVCYLIWNDPLMSIGKDTFIHDMLSKCGYENIFSHSLRYPTVTVDEIKALSPDFIFLSSEPFPFKEKHIEIYKNNFPESEIILVDGEYFSWYGSRMIEAVDYFNTLNSTIKFRDLT